MSATLRLIAYLPVGMASRKSLREPLLNDREEK